MADPTPQQIERICLRISNDKKNRPDASHLRAQWTWTDSVEIAVSSGWSAMTYRLFPADCRKLAEWLNARADEIEADRG